MANKKTIKCLGCGQVIKNEKPVRGLHAACYKATRRAILLGKTTDAARVRAGKMAPKKKRGKPPTNPVSKELLV